MKMESEIRFWWMGWALRSLVAFMGCRRGDSGCGAAGVSSAAGAAKADPGPVVLTDCAADVGDASDNEDDDRRPCFRSRWL